MQVLSRPGLAFLLTLGVLAGACGGDDVPEADAAPPGRVLEVVRPAGGEVGLAFATGAELRVRFRVGAAVLAGEGVRFTLVSDAARGESASGASLTTAEVRTDEDGLASVEVLSGNTVANFRVEASASSAPPATFYVAVTDQGFTSMRVTPRHFGVRPDAHFRAIETRLYQDRPCATIAVEAPPPSVYAGRTLSTFGQLARWDTVGAGVGHTIFAWARDEVGRALAVGCLELAPEQLRSGGQLGAELQVADRPTEMGQLIVDSQVDLAPVRAAVRNPTWTQLPCLRGPAQAFLDQVLADLGPGSVATAITNGRGVLDVAGCRGGANALGGLSVDEALTNAFTAGGTKGASLRTAGDRFVEMLATMTLSSRLDPAGGGALDHRLELLSLTVAGMTFQDDAADSLRPVVLVPAVTTTVEGSQLGLATHGFTLRLGWLARRAFEQGVLGPLGLGASVTTMGTPVATSAKVGAFTGCRAVSEATCGAAGQTPTCVETACGVALAHFDANLAAPFVALDGSGLDLVWQGVAVLHDDDHDLVTESLTGGLWSAQLKLAGATPAIAISGSFTAAAPE